MGDNRDNVIPFTRAEKITAVFYLVWGDHPKVTLIKLYIKKYIFQAISEYRSPYKRTKLTRNLTFIIDYHSFSNFFDIYDTKIYFLRMNVLIFIFFILNQSGKICLILKHDIQFVINNINEYIIF